MKIHDQFLAYRLLSLSLAKSLGVYHLMAVQLLLEMDEIAWHWQYEHRNLVHSFYLTALEELLLEMAGEGGCGD